MQWQNPDPVVPHHAATDGPAPGAAGDIAAEAAETETAHPARAPVLAVDLDGTLIRTDIAIEHLLQLLKRNPLYLFMVPLWLWRGRAALKREIAKRVAFDPADLPYDVAFLDYLRAEKAAGRKLVLATAANQVPAKAIAAHLGIFDAVFASDGTTNLSGDAKRRRLEENYGRGKFDYAGNGRADLKVWRAAAAAIVVNPDPGVLASLRAERPVVVEFAPAGPDAPSAFKPYFKAMRLHQWMKNGLLFVPLALSHKLAEAGPFLQICLAFLAFGFTASAVYLINDLVDLRDDRRHPTKRKRPFAAGTIPLVHGLLMVPVLLALAATVARLLPFEFRVVLGLYFAITLAYSFYFKRTMLFDVLVLAGLYTMRIVAGSAAISIPRSFWLLAFSIFLFFSLALVKRYVELLEMGDGAKEQDRGRSYRAVDLETLSQFGITSGMAAVLVLALYIDSAIGQKMYRNPEIIWLLCPLMLYLICRFWILARRGEMHEDPIMFAIKDWRSQAIVGVGAGLLLLAAVL
jgi:4-hydroxybenzoate polyprenyltransferase/phosphoserine phosphatase